MTTGASNPNNPVVFFDVTVGGQVIWCNILYDESVVISNNFSKRGSRHNHAHILGVASYNHAHILKDGNMIIYVNTDIV